MIFYETVTNCRSLYIVVCNALQVLPVAVFVTTTTTEGCHDCMKFEKTKKSCLL